MSTINVAVNLTWLAPGRVGGSEEYLVRQLTGLSHVAATDRELAVHLFCQPSFVSVHPALATSLNATAMPLRRDLRGARIVLEHSWLPSQVRRFDVVHNAGGTAPLLNPAKMVLTVHDVQYLSHPEYFSAARRAYLSSMVPRSIAAADIVAVPTNYVRQRIIDHFGPEPSSVQVVPHGVPPLPIPDRATVAEVTSRYRIREPYVVYAAITHPHKAHLRLVEMMRVTRRRGHPLHNHSLVLVGGVGAAESELSTAIAQSGVAERIVRTGRVPSADKDALLAGADVMAFPSQYEGFGAPLVEAMALDVPVVASDHPAIVEVVGDGGRIVAGSAADEWADAVAAVAERREYWVNAGRVRRQAFTIDLSGAALAASYHRAVAA